MTLSASQRNVIFFLFMCVPVFFEFRRCLCVDVCVSIVWFLISTNISLYGLDVVKTGKTVLMKVKGFGYFLLFLMLFLGSLFSPAVFSNFLVRNIKMFQII